MTVDTRHSTLRMTRRRRLAAVAVGLGITVAAGHDATAVAWADATHAHSDATGHSGVAGHSSDAGSRTKKHARSATRSTAAEDKSMTAHSGSAPHSAAGSTTDSTSSAVSQHHSHSATRGTTQTETATPKSGTALSTATSAVKSLTTTAAAISSTKLTSAATTTSSSTTTTTVTTPRPLSPIAQLIALPGRIINTVLQILDITVAPTGPKSPFNLTPIGEAVFAAFRGVETFFGFNKTPANQPTVPTLTYTGPTDDESPTVAQLLDAATAEYGLGTQPSDLKPFTVNGFQMQTFNPLSGAVGKAWVTPQGQIIVAYQGTSGGTNLLFHPLIALAQIVTDLQVMFTNTTPQAFRDSLAFERRVEAAASAQGYSTDDIFVTGHSLGGWEAEYVAQRTGRAGIGFESPGINTKVSGNGANSVFVNVETYGDLASYLATDLPALQPFMPDYQPAGGSKPHYGSIVMIGDPSAVDPLVNIAKLWGWNPISDLIFAVGALGNFLEHHLPGMQAYNLGVTPDPGVVPWLGATMGPVHDWAALTIEQLQLAASGIGALVAP